MNDNELEVLIPVKSNIELLFTILAEMRAE
jgi:hypothetical protein